MAPSAVVIDEANADTVTAYAVGHATSSDLNEVSGSVVTTGIAVESTGTMNGGIHHLMELAKEQVVKVLDAVNQSASDFNLMVGVSDSQTYECSGGGTYTISSTMAAVNGDGEWIPSTGDVVSMSYNSCNDTVSTSNGSISLTLGGLERDPLDETVLTEFGATVSVKNLRVVDNVEPTSIRVNGVMGLAMSGDGVTSGRATTIGGGSLVAEYNYGGVTDLTMLTDFTLADIEGINGDKMYIHDFTIYSTYLGGYITADNVSPFVRLYNNDNPNDYDDYPYVGQLVATGANNASTMWATTDNLTATIEYDLDGDGFYGIDPDPLPKIVNWVDL